MPSYLRYGKLVSLMAESPDESSWSDEKHKYEFKRLVEDYEKYSGSGTQLVTIYIPEDKHISDVVAHITQEHSQAANIKSKDTRTNVTDALASIRARLRYYKKPPVNGMVLFSGAIDVGGGQTDMVTQIFESPPRPIPSFRYHCDSNFLTDPLRDMLQEVGVYGLLVLDRREAHVGWLKGKRIEAVKGTTSRVPGKQRKGGQSAQRFHRLRLEAIDQFYKEIAELAADVFVPHRYELDGILVGGPSPTKDEFLERKYLHHELREKVLGKFDVSYTNESGLYELVDSAMDVLSDAAIVKDKIAMERFFKELHRGNRATYGFDAVRENLIMGAVARLLISVDVRKDVLSFRCKNGHEYYEMIDQRTKKTSGECSECESKTELIERVDVVEYLVKLAEYRGTEIDFVSTDFEEGNQLLNAFGGLAGILRFSTGI